MRTVYSELRYKSTQSSLEGSSGKRKTLAAVTTWNVETLPVNTHPSTQLLPPQHMREHKETKRIFPSCEFLLGLLHVAGFSYDFLGRAVEELGFHNVTPMKHGVRNADPETRHQTAARITVWASNMWKHGVDATWRNMAATWCNCNVTTCYVRNSLCSKQLRERLVPGRPTETCQ